MPCLKLRRPKLKGVDLNAVKRVVEASDKQRFTLLFVPEGEGGDERVPVQNPAQPETEHIPALVSGSVAEGSSSGDKGKERESINDITSGPGVWWIRANQGHTLKVTSAIDFRLIHTQRPLTHSKGRRP